jgi:hypothetical protein
MTEEIKVKMKEYGVKAVPTTIIDGKIKVVGIPDFPWVCGDDLYKKLRKDYPLEGKYEKHSLPLKIPYRISFL